jgi:ribosomal protein L28
MPCYHCGKGVLYGRKHTHHRGVAGGRWKKRAPKTQRIFHPNLQRIQIVENNKKVRVELCTKCLKRIKKDMGEGVQPFLQLAQ